MNRHLAFSRPQLEAFKATKTNQKLECVCLVLWISGVLTSTLEENFENSDVQENVSKQQINK